MRPPMTFSSVVVSLVAVVLLWSSGEAIIVRHDREDTSFIELGERYASVLVHMNLEEPGDPPDGEGTLVARGWVLTAAHVAVEAEPGHELTVDGRRYATERIVVHPEWDGGAGDDIALIRLRDPGDSGGPALVQHDGDVFVVGVSSTQSTRATGGREGVYGVTEYYVRVSAYADWIDRTISRNAPVRSHVAFP